MNKQSNKTAATERGPYTESVKITEAHRQRLNRLKITKGTNITFFVEQAIEKALKEEKF